MTTNLNGTFAAVQAASRELALLSDDTINQILNASAYSPSLFVCVHLLQAYVL